MAKETFHTYMNLDVVNNSTTAPQQLKFNMTRTIPFLSNAEDYFLTVARFNLQTSNSLPVFIPDIQTGQTNANMTVYSVQLDAAITNGTTTTTSSHTVPINYIPSDLTQPAPAQPIDSVDKSSSYYWVYNVSDWVAMINATLATATYAINYDLSPPPTGSTKPGTVVNAPYVQYDTGTGLFTLFADQNAILNNSFKIYFNASLYNILPFPSIVLNTGIANPYQINISNSIANQSSALITSTDATGKSISTRVNFLSITTEFSPLTLMCPIRSIYFTSNLLPIEPMLTQPPKVFTDSTLSGANSGAPGITNILTDFEIAVTPTNNYNGEISYLPSSEYRWIDLTQGVNLNKLDLQAFWKDKYGNATPIYLPVGCSANIKLLFRSKRFYLGYNY